ncbi:MAG: endolytic transglycosylase MltG [Proteobacteria bacterium]|nr:endolytic transglycosylase MltG [Pseudomonadota bacterium]
MIISFVFACFYQFSQFIKAPLSQSSDAITYELAPGTGALRMLYQLKRQGVINERQRVLLGWYIQYKGHEKSLKAGEYLIPLAITPMQLMHKLIKGEVIQYPFTLKEGATFKEVMQAIQALPKVRNTLTNQTPEEIMKLLGENGSPEGKFFPETYFYTANMTDLNLLVRAHELMHKKLHLAWQMRSPEVVVNSPYEALILASIVEKEAAQDNERSLISGVFQRRLQKNMLLQADPTVVYGVQDEYTGKLTREQLRKDTPYNTYVHKGLPPTPIACPSLKSIIAAMHPDKSEALYFVAKGDGSHVFSSDLKAHNEAVRQYQLPALYRFGVGINLEGVK